jgi:hypothetical protein
MQIAGGLRLIPQAENPKQKIFNQFTRSRQILLLRFVSLCGCGGL